MFLDTTESTIMSVLHGVAQGDQAGRSLYLARFCETYSEPLVKFLSATKRLPHDEARDLVHDFWMKKLLDVPAEDNLISKYLKSMQAGEPNSFRRYLARSLTLHFISHWRSAANRRNREALPLDAGFDIEGVNEPDWASFDDIWVSHLFQKVIDGVRQECLHDGGTADRWKIFVELKLKPCLLGTEAKSYSELASMLDLQDPKSVGNSWITVKRMFDRHLHRAVQDYIPAASIAESSQATSVEVKELLRQLAEKRVLKISLPELQSDSDETKVVSTFELSDPNNDAVYRTAEDLKAGWTKILHLPLNHWLLEGNGSETAPIITVLEDSKPALELLNAIRSQAKRYGRDKTSTLQAGSLIPTEFYAITYLLAVVLAATRLEKSITSVQPQEFSKKIYSMRSVPWLDSKSRMLFDEYLDLHEHANRSVSDF